MRFSNVFALVVSGFGLFALTNAAGCGGDDGTGGAGGSGAGGSGAGGSSAACAPACEANKDVSSECIAITDNATAGSYALRMSQLAIEKPAALANPLVVGLIDTGVTMNLEDCFLTGTGTFSWLLQFDSASGKLKTGGAKPVTDPTAGYCFVNETLAGTPVAPLEVDAKPDASGKFSVTVGGDVIVPIFLSDDPAGALLLPLRQAKIIDAVLSADRNCIGKYNSDKLDPADSCEPGGDVARFENGASLDAYITLEDADAVKISALSDQSLCVLLTGESEGTPKVCKRDANGAITSKGDWCSKTDMPADDTCFDAYKLGAKFAASAVKVTGDCK